MKQYYGICCLLVALSGINAMEKNQSHKEFWNARSYKNNSTSQDCFASYVLSLATLNKDDRALDAGCGAGWFAYRLSHTLVEVVGIDSSPAMIKQACKDYKKRGNLHFYEKDILTFKDQKGFNIIFALNSLSWIKNQKEAYKNLAQLLVEQGRLIALVADVNGPVLKAYEQASRLDRWKSFFNNYNPSYYPSSESQVKEYTRDSGFASVIVKKADILPFIIKRENFIKALASTPGVKDAISESDYNAFLEDVVDEYLKIISFDDAEFVLVDAGLLLVVAEK